MGYKKGFQRGQIPLGDFDTEREAKDAQIGRIGRAFAGRNYDKARKDGFTLGIAYAKGRWYVVLNPPGVTSYE